MGHFTTANVESFVDQHASGWGTECLNIRLSWGCKELFTARMVALSMKNDQSEIGHHDTKTLEKGRPVYRRQNGPPLGIPLAAIVDMKKMVREHIRNVSRNHLAHYVAIAYNDQPSRAMEFILGSACDWYSKGVLENNEVRMRATAVRASV
jgi:hypothetical protein